MGGVIIGFFLILLIVGTGLGSFWLYRRSLRFAKSIERGIKMVPVWINLPPASEDVEVGGRDVREVIQERISQAEVLYNLIASTATKGFKSKFFGQRHFALEIVAIGGTIRFYAAVPVALLDTVKQAILTAYPGAQLEEVEDHNIFSPEGKISGTYGGEVVLKKPAAYPIATFTQLKRDAMQAMINAFSTLTVGDGAALQILIRPANPGWTKSSESEVKKKKDGGGKSGISAKTLLQAPFKAPESGSSGGESKPPKQLTSLEQSTLDAIEDKTRSTGFEVLIRIIASSASASRSQAIARNLASGFSLFDAPGLNGFKFQPAKDIEKFVTSFIFRFFPPEKNKNVLNSIELATLFHFPEDQFTRTSQVERQYSKQVEGPANLSRSGSLLGYNVYRGVKKEIRLSDDDRRRHVYIVGQTGTGKSVTLTNLLVQDMRAGRGFAFIDPHGDSAETILSMVPPERSEDVIYFNPGDMEHPLGLNMFEYNTPEQKDFLIQEAINMLYRLYDPQRQGMIGARYEHIFRNAALTVMADPAGGTFIDIPKLFRDPQFVKQKLKHVTDATVTEFWTKEMPQAQRSNEFGDLVSWFVSKFGAFLSNEMMRNIIGQSKSSIDLREIMDSGKILIANLSKGRLGEINSMLLGMIFVTKFQSAAMSRANVLEKDRRDFTLYVDEFQNFSTESFAFILSESRKYRLQLVVANQFISQLSDEVREAVFGNVGTIISLRTGPSDADFLVKQFAPAFNERDLVNLPNLNAAVRLMSGGLPSQPFNMQIPLPTQHLVNPAMGEALKMLSAAKYGRPRASVEDEIFARLATKPIPSPFDSLSASGAFGASAGPAGGPAMTPGRPASPAAVGSASGGAGGSSFLDEWLAKRRQTLQQTAAAPLAPQPGSQNPTSAPAGTLQASVTPPPGNRPFTQPGSPSPVSAGGRSSLDTAQPLSSPVSNPSPAGPPFNDEPPLAPLPPLQPPSAQHEHTERRLQPPPEHHVSGLDTALLAVAEIEGGGVPASAERKAQLAAEPASLSADNNLPPLPPPAAPPPLPPAAPPLAAAQPNRPPLPEPARQPFEENMTSLANDEIPPPTTVDENPIPPPDHLEISQPAAELPVEAKVPEEKGLRHSSSVAPASAPKPGQPMLPEAASEPLSGVDAMLARHEPTTGAELPGIPLESKPEPQLENKLPLQPPTVGSDGAEDETAEPLPEPTEDQATGAGKLFGGPTGGGMDKRADKAAAQTEEPPPKPSAAAKTKSKQSTAKPKAKSPANVKAKFGLRPAAKAKAEPRPALLPEQADAPARSDQPNTGQNGQSSARPKPSGSAAGPELKSGEIYIDESGQIHHG